MANTFRYQWHHGHKQAADGLRRQLRQAEEAAEERATELLEILMRRLGIDAYNAWRATLSYTSWRSIELQAERKLATLPAVYEIVFDECACKLPGEVCAVCREQGKQLEETY